MANWWIPYIQQRAAQLGIDPRAALAVAQQEGLSGRVGDGGHAFGPFQLNDAGGVLTGRPGDHRAFAESKAGIDWALHRIAAVAGGLTGQKAVNAIVTQFERPADPSKEIAGALGAYGHVSGPISAGHVAGLAGGVPHDAALSSALPSALGGMQTQAANAALSSILNDQMTRFLSGDTTPHPEDTASIAALVSMRQQAGAAQQQYGPTPTSGGITPSSDVRNGIVNIAKNYLGVPYKWGGNDPKTGLDCSAFTQQVLAKAGVNLGRTTYQQFKQGTPVNLRQLKPGDLVFTHPEAQGPGHVGLYIGNGRVQESPHTGTVNSIIPLNSFVADGFVGARRYL